MQQIRIINLLMQSAYLIGHLLFIVLLYRKRQPTPIWRWFFAAAAAIWIWVHGRFLETIVYLFFPDNNDAYVFAANYQYIGNMTAVVSYVIWVLYLSGHERAASNKWLRAFLFACPVTVCTLVFTNPWHRLFYTRLVMGERVAHGPMFVPCIIWSYAILFTGYIVSVRHVLRTGRDVVRQILMFSLFPIVPAAGVLVRSATGVDLVDYTPLIMAVSMICLYQIVFRHHYVNIISASVRDVIEQAVHPIGFYAGDGKDLIYANRIAREQYPDLLERGLPALPDGQGAYEETFGGRRLTVEVKPLEQGTVLAAGTDVSDIVEQQAAIDRQIAEQETLRQALEEANRNIDAYLSSLYSAEGVQAKQELITRTYAAIRQTFARVAENLRAAKAAPEKADAALNENLALTRDCLTEIRRAVTLLKEG